MISGFFDGVSAYPFVRLYVSIPSLATGYRPVSLLLDTGAATTIIHPASALYEPAVPERELDPSAWGTVERIEGIGGFTPCRSLEASYVLEHDDGEYDAFADTVLVAAVTASNRSAPSLLGWNLLQHYRLTLERAAGAVTLE